MIKIKDKKIIVLVVILIVFTIGYFTVVNKVSHAFETDVDYNTIKNIYLNKFGLLDENNVKKSNEFLNKINQLFTERFNKQFSLQMYDNGVMNCFVTEKTSKIKIF